MLQDWGRVMERVRISVAFIVGKGYDPGNICMCSIRFRERILRAKKLFLNSMVFWTTGRPESGGKDGNRYLNLGRGFRGVIYRCDGGYRQLNCPLNEADEKVKQPPAPGGKIRADPADRSAYST